jgi:hypothetical protein
MNSSPISITRSAKPALELISLATMSPELARQSLRALLMFNPNYFAKITSDSFKAVLRIQQDTTYESIGYVGYSPNLEQLQATIHLSQSSGYSHSDGGSKEYVRFYLSYDRGLSWLDQGLSAINVWDTTGPMPRQDTVSVGITPALTFYFLDRLPVVRTILSWNAPPPADSPEWIPVWGDVLNAQICLEEMDEIPLHRGLEGFSNPETGCAAC